MSETDDIVLIGCGTGGPLQLGTEAFHLLERYGFAFSVGVSPHTSRHLGAHAIEVERLDEVVAGHDEPADGLLAAADRIFKQTEIESPVLVLVPGNPLLLNSLARFVVAEGRRRDLMVRRIAGVSLIDVAINEIGFDVSTRGIQVFDIEGVINRGNRPAEGVPTLLLGLAAPDHMGDRLERLGHQLAELYPAHHPITLVNVDETGTTTHASAPLDRFGEFAEHLHSGSCLFIAPVVS